MLLILWLVDRDDVFDRHNLAGKAIIGGHVLECMVVQDSSPLVEPPRVPRIRKAEKLEIEVMAELVAEGAQERAERSDLFAHRYSHPDRDDFRLWCIVAKKLKRPALSNPQLPRREYTNPACCNFVEI